jgi:hypothetical protein
VRPPPARHAREERRQLRHVHRAEVQARHAGGAESLASWPWRNYGAPKIHTGGTAATIRPKASTGAIFFKDCSTRNGEAARVGDHIDLSNKDTTQTHGDPDDEAIQTWYWTVA